MKKQIILLVVVFFASLLGSCGIFNGGCKCPKVSYQSYPGK